MSQDRRIQDHLPDSGWSLRRIEERDVDWIYEACQDPLIQRWTLIPRPYTREHAISFTQDLAGDVAVWAIEKREMDRPLGVLGIHSISECDGAADIGYWMAPWGRGIGGMKAALSLLLSELGNWPTVAAVKATIAESNTASRRTVESAGFELLGPSEQSCRCGDEQVNAVTYEKRL